MAQFFCQMLYSIIWHIFIPIWLILQIPNILKGKTQRVKDRLALYPKRESSEKKCIWFHGSSLGEIISLFPLMKKMEASFPHLQILSCSTDRGMYIAQKESCAHQNIYLPLDIEYIVKKVLRRCNLMHSLFLKRKYGQLYSGNATNRIFRSLLSQEEFLKSHIPVIDLQNHFSLA